LFKQKFVQALFSFHLKLGGQVFSLGFSALQHVFARCFTLWRLALLSLLGFWLVWPSGRDTSLGYVEGTKFFFNLTWS
jgi:hypothetical protein